MKKKYYVVWAGRETGIFDTWDSCQKQITNFAGALYKSFKTKEEAQQAFNEGYSKMPQKNKTSLLVGAPISQSISVDGAWNTATGVAEYQGVETQTKKILFKAGPFDDGTNNVVEFLALIHALAYCKQHNLNIPIYSDSRTAISWLRQKKAKTSLKKTTKNQKIFELLHRAEKWLHENTYENKVLKWETECWGENPADFGRK
ncbi:MAG: ribonuclease H family protein [Bacteroidetes bacterium]|nr:ribonuclease H family protein [Bacteroidota bacterium]